MRACHIIPEGGGFLCKEGYEFSTIRQDNAQSGIGMRNWPLQDSQPGGCIDLLDCAIVGLDEEGVFESEELMQLFY